MTFNTRILPILNILFFGTDKSKIEDILRDIYGNSSDNPVGFAVVGTKFIVAGDQIDAVIARTDNVSTLHVKV